MELLPLCACNGRTIRLGGQFLDPNLTADRPDIEPDKSLIIEGTKGGVPRIEWTMADYNRLVELEQMAARGEDVLKELDDLTARMPCSREEALRADALGA